MATVDYSKSFELPKFDHRILDLRGHRFGKLIVDSFAGRNAKNLIIWNCVCDCGGKTLATSASLRSKVERSAKRSCGCLAVEVTRNRSITHGKHGSPEYQSWRSMIGRCENPNATGYKNYGGRGITICDSWRKSFERFFQDMGERPSMECQIDRIDNDGNYEPSNCRWATVKQQANNRRKKTLNLVIEFKGESKTLPEWAELLGVKVGTLYARRWRGLPVDQVLVGNKRLLHSKAS
jgi:hypothetical protein